MSFKILLTVFISCCMILYAQKKLTYNVVYEVDFQKKQNTSSDSSLVRVSPSLNIQDIEYAVSRNFIFICDVRNNYILKMDRNGKYKDKILLPSHDNSKFRIYTRENNDLFLLELTYNGFFKNFYSYNDSSGELNEFPLKGEKPEGIGKFYVDQMGQILINSFPLSMNFNYLEKGKVFIYDATGNFRGRTDYFYKNYDDEIYCFKRDGKSFYVLKANNSSNSIVKLEQLNLEFQFNIDFVFPSEIKGGRWVPPIDRWRFIGFDISNNLYFKNDFSIRTYSRNGKLLRNVDISELDKIGYPRQSRRYEVSPNGTIFLLTYKKIENVPSSLTLLAVSLDE